MSRPGSGANFGPHSLSGTELNERPITPDVPDYCRRAVLLLVQRSAACHGRR